MVQRQNDQLSSQKAFLEFIICPIIVWCIWLDIYGECSQRSV